MSLLLTLNNIWIVLLIGNVEQVLSHEQVSGKSSGATMLISLSFEYLKLAQSEFFWRNPIIWISKPCLKEDYSKWSVKHFVLLY